MTDDANRIVLEVLTARGGIRTDTLRAMLGWSRDRFNTALTEASPRLRRHGGRLVAGDVF